MVEDIEWLLQIRLNGRLHWFCILYLLGDRFPIGDIASVVVYAGCARDTAHHRSGIRGAYPHLSGPFVSPFLRRPASQAIYRYGLKCTSHS